MKILVICSPCYDFSVSNLIEGFIQIKRKNNNFDFRVTERSNYSYAYNMGLLHDYSIMNKDAIDYGKEADLIVLTSNRFVKENIEKIINRREKTVFLDGIDEEGLYRNPKEFPLYFKREMMVFNEYDYDNIIPFPFAAENRYFTCHVNGNLEEIYNLDINKIEFKFDHKNINLSCMFGKTDKRKQWRNWVKETIKNMNLENCTTESIYSKSIDKTKFYIDTGNRYHYDYFENLYNSKISIDSYGADGASTSRFYESLANCCCIISQPIRIIIPESQFIEDEDYISFYTPKELKEKILYFMNNEEKIKNIAQNSFEKIKKFHTSEKRAEYFLRKCREHCIL